MACLDYTNVIQILGFPADTIFTEHVFGRDQFDRIIISPQNYYISKTINDDVINFFAPNGQEVQIICYPRYGKRFIELINQTEQQIVLSKIAEEKGITCFDKFIGSYCTTNEIYYVFDYNDRTNLSEFVLKNSNYLSENPQRLYYVMYHIALTISQLIDNIPEFLTRLTLDNIFVQSDLKIKIVPNKDVAEQFEHLTPSTYQAPEVLTSGQPKDITKYESIMVWMFGYLVSSMFARKPFIKGITVVDLLIKLSKNFGMTKEFLEKYPLATNFVQVNDGKDIHAVFPQIESEQVLELIKMTMKINDFERPTFKQILQHPLFESFRVLSDFEAILFFF